MRRIFITAQGNVSIFPTSLRLISVPVPHHPVSPYLSVPATFLACRPPQATSALMCAFQRALISATLLIGCIHVPRTTVRLLFLCIFSRTYCAIFPRLIYVRRACSPSTSLPSIPSYRPLFIPVHSTSRACMSTNFCTPHLSRRSTAVPVSSLSCKIRCTCTLSAFAPPVVHNGRSKVYLLSFLFNCCSLRFSTFVHRNPLSLETSMIFACHYRHAIF